MKVISCELKNFASYEHLEFNFDSKGLNLIHGATGSGKSTLCDVIPWVLFGKTSKGGSVDEVLSWPGDAITYGNVSLSTGINIYRIRGPKAKDNDLYYSTSPGQVIRGKDITDTQRLINSTLGMNYELYLSGAYFHEFSQTAQFFTTTAKNRRMICEQLVDLSLASDLQTKIKTQTKLLESELQVVNNETDVDDSNLALLSKMLGSEQSKESSWAKTRVNKEATLKAKMTAFDDDKNTQILGLKVKINNLKLESDSKYEDLLSAMKADLPPESEKCKECGSPKANPQRDKLLKEIQFIEKCRIDNSALIREAELLNNQLKTVESQVNTYEEQISELIEQLNPHAATVQKLESDIDSLSTHISRLRTKESELVVKLSDHDILSDIVADFRGILIKNMILDIEAKTNLLLHDYFDSEIKIELSVEDADKLEVTIQKDGNTCSYTQLSKGQRQILKLCFGASVMQAIANHNGVTFDQLFFDEATDGMDDATKLKAVHMLEALATQHDSVYLVEHSETIKAMVNNKYKVELIDGKSQICQL